MKAGFGKLNQHGKISGISYHILFNWLLESGDWSQETEFLLCTILENSLCVNGLMWSKN